MVDVATVRALAERLAKAEALVATGAVAPVAGLEGYSVVRNGDGDSMYLVRFEAGHESCTCPDFRERQSKVGQPCKHLLAAQLAAAAGPKPEPTKRTKKVETEAPQAEAPRAFAPGEALARLQGDPADNDPYPFGGRAA